MKIDVKVTPRASTDEVVGWSNQVLRVRVHATPERGRANDALEKLIAKALGLSSRAVQVVTGHTSSRKVVEIQGLDADEVRRRLGSGV